MKETIGKIIKLYVTKTIPDFMYRSMKTINKTILEIELSFYDHSKSEEICDLLVATWLVCDGDE